MVFLDLNTSHGGNEQSLQDKTPASLLSRSLSFVIDYFLFSPLAALVMAVFFNKSVFLSQKINFEPLLIQLLFFETILFTFFQTVFIYFKKATPGQFFMKIYASIERKHANVFLQIWLRQIGFIFSLLLLGIPFLAIFYHPRRRTFYDRLCEIDIFTRGIQSQNKDYVFSLSDFDRKYIASTVSTCMVFCLVIGLFLTVNHHQKSLKNVISQVDFYKKEKTSCLEIDRIPASDKVKTALVLNLLNLVSDDCLNNEADRYLQQVHLIDEKNKETVSLAYLSKYILSQNKDEESSYAHRLCQSDLSDHSVCLMVGQFYQRGVASEKNDKHSKEFRRHILTQLGLKL